MATPRRFHWTTIHLKKTWNPQEQLKGTISHLEYFETLTVFQPRFKQACLLNRMFLFSCEADVSFKGSFFLAHPSDEVLWMNCLQWFWLLMIKCYCIRKTLSWAKCNVMFLNTCSERCLDQIALPLRKAKK